MDPQQRLLLESAYCSLAVRDGNNSFGSTSLSGTSFGGTQSTTGKSTRSLPSGVSQGNVGVYIGISYNEYGPMAGAVAGRVSTYTATGSSLSVAAGYRPAYSHLLVP